MSCGIVYYIFKDSLEQCIFSLTSWVILVWRCILVLSSEKQTDIITAHSQHIGYEHIILCFISNIGVMAGHISCYFTYINGLKIMNLFVVYDTR